MPEGSQIDLTMLTFDSTKHHEDTGAKVEPDTPKAWLPYPKNRICCFESAKLGISRLSK